MVVVGVPALQLPAVNQSVLMLPVQDVSTWPWLRPATPSSSSSSSSSSQQVRRLNNNEG